MRYTIADIQEITNSINFFSVVARINNQLRVIELPYMVTTGWLVFTYPLGKPEEARTMHVKDTRSFEIVDFN